MHRGFIKLYRAIQDNDIWFREPFTRGQAWLDLLIISNHKEGYIRVRGNRIKILRGQCGWSIKRLADRWKWSQGKVKRFLKELKEDGQIGEQNNPVTTVITIVNYEVYQGNGEQTESRRRLTRMVRMKRMKRRGRERGSHHRLESLFLITLYRYKKK